MYRMVFLSGSRRGQRVAVRGGSSLIGRDKDCEILVEGDKKVAPRHVRLEYRPDGVYMKRESSASAVLCNEKKVDSKKLVSGDELEIGETRLLFQEIRNTGFADRRKVSKMQLFAIFAALIVIILEIGFVIGFSVYRSNQIVEVRAGESVSTNQVVETPTNLSSATNQVAEPEDVPTPPAGRTSREIEIFTPDVEEL